MRFSEVVATLTAVLSLALVPSANAVQQGSPKFDEWGDSFDGSDLESTKWERFSFEGGTGGTFKIEKGVLSMRGINGSRSGIRSKQTFDSDQIIVDATVAKVGSAYPDPESGALPIGNAIVTMLFDGSGRNRVEWLLTSEGTFEAWAMIDGKGERLDNRSLGTKIANPTLSIARRGDEFIFALNGQVGLQKTVRGFPRTTRVMLYGFGTSENVWDSVRVTTVRPQAAPKP
jgi:hypothetical protein